MKNESESSTSLCLPFLGSRANNELFEYLLLKINDHSALISLPNWVVNRTILQDSEKISLHLKRYLKNSYCVNDNVSGQALRLDSSKGGFESLYRVEFTTPLMPNLKAPEEESSKEIKHELIELVKDSYFLKNGVFVYLKHLIPYFSRILKFSDEEYKDLKSALLDDVHERIRANMRGLEKLYQQLEAQVTRDRDLVMFLDLDKLRKMIQSEIDLNLFEIALDDSKTTQYQSFEHLLSKQTHSKKSFFIYLHSIKVVEDRLYDNYNYIVSLYAQSLTPLAPLQTIAST